MDNFSTPPLRDHKDLLDQFNDKIDQLSPEMRQLALRLIHGMLDILIEEEVSNA